MVVFWHGTEKKHATIPERKGLNLICVFVDKEKIDRKAVMKERFRFSEDKKNGTPTGMEILLDHQTEGMVRVLKRGWKKTAALSVG